jgi:hypothetical protein
VNPSHVVIGHPTCDMGLQRRIAETRRDVVARSVGRKPGRRSLMDRILRREARGGLVNLDADAFREPGEDVWHALRF